jgi:hypothetical protein
VRDGNGASLAREPRRQGCPRPSQSDDTPPHEGGERGSAPPESKSIRSRVAHRFASTSVWAACPKTLGAIQAKLPLTPISLPC